MIINALSNICVILLLRWFRVSWVLLIGLSLIKVGIISCGGGYTAMDNGTFASWENLSIAGAVLLSVLFLTVARISICA